MRLVTPIGMKWRFLKKSLNTVFRSMYVVVNTCLFILRQVFSNDVRPLPIIAPFQLDFAVRPLSLDVTLPLAI